MRPYLQHARVVVAPLRVARGIQNKILEAMAMARPVVTRRPQRRRQFAAHVGAEFEVAAGARRSSRQRCWPCSTRVRARSLGRAARAARARRLQTGTATCRPDRHIARWRDGPCGRCQRRWTCTDATLIPAHGGAAGTVACRPRLSSRVAAIVHRGAGFVFWPTTASMIEIWRHSDTFQHCFLVIPIVLWLVWNERQRLAATRAQPLWPGLHADRRCRCGVG